jgi:hypothetical protein
VDVRRRLANKLTRELFQSERSATRHPRIEAERLGDCPPAHAMLAVAQHADSCLSELERLAPRCGLPTGGVGETVGVGFSVLRDGFFDLLIDHERSYRGTILGMRHGEDLVRLYRAVAATTDGCAQMVEFCSRWLDERPPLIQACVEQLDWFALYPERALETAGLAKRSGAGPIARLMGRTKTPEPA